MTDETLLHRQVNPSWLQQGRVTSQAFKPTPKDDKRLSVYDGDQVTAEAAWRHYAGELKHQSVGVLAVTKGECEAQGLPVEPDPRPFPAHVVIRFDGYTNSQIEKKAKRLSDAAQSRKWQFQAALDG